MSSPNRAQKAKMHKHRLEPPIPITAHTPLGRMRAFRDAAHQFVECVAFGPGAWDLMPEEFREVLTRNYLVIESLGVKNLGEGPDLRGRSAG